MLKIRRPLGRLIFNMGIAIPGKTVFLIETAPWFCNYAFPWIFLLLDILFEYWIEHVTFGPLYVMFRFSIRVFYRGVPGFETECSCGVWRPVLLTFLLYVGPRLGNLVWNDSGCISLTSWMTTFSLFYLCIYIYINAPQYDNILFSLTLLLYLK